jgi:hypothetical protein
VYTVPVFGVGGNEDDGHQLAVWPALGDVVEGEFSADGGHWFSAVQISNYLEYVVFGRCAATA